MKYLLLSLALMTSALARSQGYSEEWPLFRGKPDLAGKTDFELPASPTLLWSLKTGVSTKSSPVVSEGTIYFGNDKGYLIAVSADGKIKWSYEGGSAIESPPMIFGNKVILGTNEGHLRAVDKFTGKLIWNYNTENQIAGSANIWTDGNRAGIVVGSYDYYLHCVDPRTGRLLWKVETDNYINGAPAISNGRIVFGGCDGVVRVVDPPTGKETDTLQIGVYIASSPALSGDLAFLGDYDGNRYCLNIKSGKIAWKAGAAEGSGSVMAVPAIRDNYMIVGSEDNYLYCYDIATGKIIWKYRSNGSIDGSAVVTPSKVLFSGMDGNVTILALKDGKKLWSFDTGSQVSSSPAVINGRFYILTGDGRLLAFGTR